MSAFDVIWTDAATDAVIDIVMGFGVDRIELAEKNADEIFEAGNSLALFPLRGRVVPELEEIGERNLREIFHKPSRIIYEVAEYKVIILLVIDGRRDGDDLLRELLLRKR
jgi:plasmid stabilization system protein ParE